jgi:uncharacterized protein (DUF111 family)
MYAHLFVEPIGGVAGDMLLAALIDVGADVDGLRSGLARLMQPGLRLDVSRVVVGELPACYVRSLGPDEGHVHRRLGDIEAVIERAQLSPTARARASRIFAILAEAEAVVHGGGRDDVELHEVGALDSILDVVGISLALDLLGNPRVSAAPLPSGRGPVKTAHGDLACPVPAVVEIARRFSVPLEPVALAAETVTPTGIAVLAATCEHFGARPAGEARRVGVGAGTRRFADRPNVVRVYAYD